MRYVNVRVLKVGDEVRQSGGGWYKVQDVVVGVSKVAVQGPVFAGDTILVEFPIDAEVLVKDAPPLKPIPSHWEPGLNYEKQQRPSTSVRAVLVDDQGLTRRVGDWRLTYDDAMFSLFEILSEEVLRGSS